MTFCTEIEKTTLKYIWKHKRPWIVKEILSKKSNTGSSTIPNFKQHYRAITIKTTCYWHKNRQKEQWIRIENPDINPHIYSQLIFHKVVQNTQWRRQLLQQMLLGKLVFHMQKTETRSLSFTLYPNQLKVDQRP
jgi:hypothetical protein